MKIFRQYSQLVCQHARPRLEQREHTAYKNMLWYYLMTPLTCVHVSLPARLLLLKSAIMPYIRTELAEVDRSIRNEKWSMSGLNGTTRLVQRGNEIGFKMQTSSKLTRFSDRSRDRYRSRPLLVSIFIISCYKGMDTSRIRGLIPRSRHAITWKLPF